MCEGTGFIYNAVQSMILFGNNRKQAVFAYFNEFVCLDEGRKHSNIGIYFKCTVKQILAFVALLCKATAEVVSGHSYGLVLCWIALKPRPYNRPVRYCCYGHDDFQLAATTASYRAAEERSCY